MTAHPSARLTILALLAGAACTVQIAGNDRTALIRGTVTLGGGAVANAVVRSGNVSTTTRSDGTYNLNLRGEAPDRIVIEVLPPAASAGADAGSSGSAGVLTRALVEYRGGVFHYLADIALPPLTRLTPGSETTLAVGTRTVKVKAPAGSAPDGGALEVAVLPPEAGPAAMETTEAVDQRLQSSAVFFLRGLDAQGRVVPLSLSAAQAVSFTIDSALTALPDTQALKIYSQGDDGRWAPSSATPGAELFANAGGYWLAGRAYKTACVKGVLRAPTKSCTGERIRVGAVDGVFTQDTTGNAGAFCLDGPQGRTVPMAVGARTLQIAFPAKAGSCRVDPGACLELSTGTSADGGVDVADTDCPVSCLKTQIDDPSSSTGCSVR